VTGSVVSAASVESAEGASVEASLLAERDDTDGDESGDEGDDEDGEEDPVDEPCDGDGGSETVGSPDGSACRSGDSSRAAVAE
jgi:hypothetical protein